MKRIVLLNDELGSQMQIYLALCDGYSVEIAESVEAAMYLLRKLQPEILVMDYDLTHFRVRGKQGIDFIRKVKRKYGHLKIVTILDDKDKIFETEIQENGADGIIYRPIKNRHVIFNVRKVAESLNTKNTSIPTHHAPAAN
jgi:DNA-binding NarL/FixJ family response regulator